MCVDVIDVAWIDARLGSDSLMARAAPRASGSGLVAA